MRFTPMDITNRTFSKSIRGFEAEEVSGFLHLVSEDMASLIAENAELKKEVEHLRESLKDLKERERILKDTMLLAQETKEDVQRNAMKEADIIVRESELQAEKIVANAYRRMESIQSDIDDLIRSRESLRRGIEDVLNKTRGFLDSMDAIELNRDPEEEEA